MLKLANPQSVNWGSWFSVVKFDWAWPVSFCPDGIIRAVYVHGIIVQLVDSWFYPPGVCFGGVLAPSPDYY